MQNVKRLFNETPTQFSFKKSRCKKYISKKTLKNQIYAEFLTGQYKLR